MAYVVVAKNRVGAEEEEETMPHQCEARVEMDWAVVLAAGGHVEKDVGVDDLLPIEQRIPGQEQEIPRGVSSQEAQMDETEVSTKVPFDLWPNVREAGDEDQARPVQQESVCAPLRATPHEMTEVPDSEG